MASPPQGAIEFSDAEDTTGAQRDHESAFQHFYRWLRSDEGSSGPPNNRFVPLENLIRYFGDMNHRRLFNTLHALFPSGIPPSIHAPTIVRDYIRVYAVLLSIGRGAYIVHFLQYQLADQKLPLEVRPPSFPRTSRAEDDSWISFYNRQWMVFPVTMQYHCEICFAREAVLPILTKERISEGGTSVTYKIEIHPQYNHLHKHDSADFQPSSSQSNCFVLKTYDRHKFDLQHHQHERDAYLYLRNEKRRGRGLIGFYGSFIHGDEHNIILEYADRGTLEDFLQGVEPATEDNIFRVWNGVFGILEGLVRLHEVLPSKESGQTHILQGWHQDINPSNILAKTRGTASKYDCEFALADLGLSHLKKDMGDDVEDGDTHGTREYGAPECYRRDEFDDQSLFRVTNKVDVWSLGAVLSEVATWVVSRTDGLEQYRGERQRITGEIKDFRDIRCFHDGSRVLEFITKDHHPTLRRRARGCDQITPMALNIIDDMLFPSSARPPATYFRTRAASLLRDIDPSTRQQRSPPITTPTSAGSSRGTPFSSPRDSQTRWSGQTTDRISTGSPIHHHQRGSQDQFEHSILAENHRFDPTDEAPKLRHMTSSSAYATFQQNAIYPRGSGPSPVNRNDYAEASTLPLRTEITSGTSNISYREPQLTGATVGDALPDMISTISNLANTLGDQGKLDEVGSMQKVVLEKGQQTVAQEDINLMNISDTNERVATELNAPLRTVDLVTNSTRYRDANGVSQEDDSSTYTIETGEYSGKAKSTPPTRMTPVESENRNGSELDAAEITDNKSATLENIDPLSDVISIVSDEDDIRSQRRRKRGWQEVFVEEQISAWLAQNKELEPLFRDALNKLDKERFVNNFRKLLKRYYLDISPSATNNLERATVSVLRSRWSRIRMAQRIVNEFHPETEELRESIQSGRKAMKKKAADVEAWIRDNPAFASSMDNDSELSSNYSSFQIEAVENEEEASSDEEDSGESANEEENLDSAAPNVTKIKNFLMSGTSFQSLYTNFRVFLLPISLAHITRVVTTIPRDRIWFSSEDDVSLANTIKTFVENQSEGKWNWWPFRQRMHHLQNDQTRIHWHCHCNTHLWAELSTEHARIYQSLLAQDRLLAPDNHLCKGRVRSLSAKSLLAGIITATGPTSSSSVLPQWYGSSKTPTADGSRASKSGAGKNRPIQANKTALSPHLSAQQSPQTSTADTSADRLFVLFGVQGARWSLELAQIDSQAQDDDAAFFRALANEYKKLRGFFRRWFSVWEFDRCDFVKFEKTDRNRILGRCKELPIDLQYEYKPRPPRVIPPIDPHEFKMAWKTCTLRCMLSILPFHDCVEPPIGKSALERVPKRKGELKMSSREREDAWGLKAEYDICLLNVVLYHILILSGTFVFWGVYEAKHPNDASTAAVPTTIVLAFLSLFWSLAGIVKRH